MSDTYRESAEQRTCVRCNVPVVPVTVLDQGGAKIYLGLTYILDRAPATSLWNGAVTNAKGTLHAHVCPSCQLVAWYAQPSA